MKLLSLNTWGGRAGLDDFLQFVKKHQDVDIFCFQEIWNGGEEITKKIFPDETISSVEWNFLEKIAAILPEHQYFFRPCFFDCYGPTIFIKKNIQVQDEGEVFVYKDQGYYSKTEMGDHARNIQYINIETDAGKRTIINFHGLWTGNGKGDTPDRLLQSENILQFLKTIKNPFVLSGDFNLVPESESIQKLEQFPLRNLIRENNITSTRTSLYSRPVRFADYIFISEGIQVNSFQIFPDEVSDHSPLYLEFT